MSRGLSGCRDHPRSRGVYYRQATAVRRLGGSSPLARGLLHDDRVLRDGPGIIPARAGFTSRRPPTGVPTRDHPRSRGVYHAEPGAKLHVGGSSPLARGLPPTAHALIGSVRIIPARAGFTVGACQAGRSSRDHPRSRGVYCVAVRVSDGAPGSSPLARGLLEPGDPRRQVERIIPARAGFTSSGGTPSDWDSGSSPLARGLPLDLGELVRGRRIIPARAGFTGHLPCIRRGRSDHPRSRGVYVFEFSDTVPCEGSSPLARGLPGNADSVDQASGIIPARAGFTASTASTGTGPRDHPRSRGVYTVECRTRTPEDGSSPLARGLPGAVPAELCPVGIIPARAGFTPRAS